MRAIPARRARSRVCGAGMDAPGEGGPEEDGGDRAPGAGAGLAEACAEEGGDGPGPAVVVAFCGLGWGRGGLSLHRSLRLGRRR